MDFDTARQLLVEYDDKETRRRIQSYLETTFAYRQRWQYGLMPAQFRGLTKMIPSQKQKAATVLQHQSGRSFLFSRKGDAHGKKEILSAAGRPV